jgi:hypothetical protein
MTQFCLRLLGCTLMNPFQWLFQRIPSCHPHRHSTPKVVVKCNDQNHISVEWTVLQTLVLPSTINYLSSTFFCTYYLLRTNCMMCGLRLLVTLAKHKHIKNYDYSVVEFNNEQGTRRQSPLLLTDRESTMSSNLIFL